MSPTRANTEPPAKTIRETELERELEEARSLLASFQSANDENARLRYAAEAAAEEARRERDAAREEAMLQPSKQYMAHLEARIAELEAALREIAAHGNSFTRTQLEDVARRALQPTTDPTP